jgi:hypothetical protein
MAYQNGATNTVEAFTQGMPPVVSLSAATAISSGTSLNGLAVRQNAVMSITLSATATAGTVVLQASLDGVNWWNTTGTASPTSAGTTAVTVAGVYAQYVRAAITVAVVGTGANLTVSVGLNG